MDTSPSPGRLILVAAGVVHYPSRADYEDIACAIQDAENIYSRLARGAPEVFDDRRSTVMANPTSTEFTTVLTLTRRSLAPNDLLVVYFSGHGHHSNDMLNLDFADAQIDAQDRVVSGYEVRKSIANHRAVLILDCCSAGDAIPLTHQAGLKEPTISVLAATRPAGRASHSSLGSEFTEALCRAVDLLADAGSPLSLVALAETVRQDPDYEGECQLSIADGSPDVRLAPGSASFEPPADLVSRFLRVVASSDAPSREMLWYSTAGLPVPLRAQLLRGWVDEKVTDEASWLVRRAIGSVLGDLPEESPTRRSVSHDLLYSASWMDQAVGVIALRHRLHEPSILERMHMVLRCSDEMDLTWLANLYLSDYGCEQLGIALETPLIETEWGVVELWERYCYYGDPHQNIEAHSRILDAVRERADVAHLVTLGTHVALRGLLDRMPVPAELNYEVVNDPLARHLYLRPHRGSVKHPAGKWLLSSLYGNWRNQVDPRLRTVLSHLSPRNVSRSLKRASEVPAYWLRSSIFHDRDLELLDLDGSALEWGIRDQHPWVRRYALERAPARADLALDAIDRRRFPGFTDLALLFANLNRELLAEWLDLHEVSGAEREAFDGS